VRAAAAETDVTKRELQLLLDVDLEKDVRIFSATCVTGPGGNVAVRYKVELESWSIGSPGGRARVGARAVEAPREAVDID